MPTVLRVDGLRFVIYPNDHRPAHVHVVGPDWEAVINLNGIELREIHAGTIAQARLALHLAAAHKEILLDTWRHIYG